MDGLLVIDKPIGPTSHDVVVRVRRVLGEARIGHTGTLDPAAGGVLPLVVGRATRLARFLSASHKSYDAVVRLGVATDTGDSAGQRMGAAFAGPIPTRGAIDRVLDEFRGTFLQLPPAYSAKKIAGKRSHRLARAASRSLRDGDDPSATAAEVPAAVHVTTHAIGIVSVDDSRVTLRVDCSAGFYVRALARDLGDRLGIGAHLEALVRTRSGDITLADALPLAAAEDNPQIAVDALVPLARMLPAMMPLFLTDEGARRAVHGRDLGAIDFEGGLPIALVNHAGSGAVPSRFRLLDKRGDLVGVGEPVETSGLLHPAVVLV